MTNFEIYYTNTIHASQTQYHFQEYKKAPGISVFLVKNTDFFERRQLKDNDIDNLRKHR